MTRYYKVLDENGRVAQIGTGDGGVEITEAEYYEILEYIQYTITKAKQVLYDDYVSKHGEVSKIINESESINNSLQLNELGILTWVNK